MPSGRLTWIGLVALVALVAGQTQPLKAQEATNWGERVDPVIYTPEYHGAHWGLLVVDAATGRTLFERNADQLFCPASVTKLFTTAAALVDLGADHQFRTPIVRNGEIRDGTLQGDLILVGQGDMSLGGRTGADGSLLFDDNDHSYGNGGLVPCDPLAGLVHLAREVQARGIRTITGDVLIDDRLFEAAPSTGSGPTHVSPVVLNDNIIDVVVTPGPKVGDPARVRFVPETSFASADVRVETVAEGDGRSAVQVRSAGPRRFTVRGRIAVNHGPLHDTYEVDEPAAFARALLIETLRSRGVHLPNASPLGENQTGKLPSRTEVAHLPTVAEYLSPPLREYVRVILKVSQNLHASTLPLILAAKRGSTTLQNGLQREAEVLEQLGLDKRTLSFGGGAGGSRSDLATPRTTVALLRAMARRPDFAAFENALPILGRDGTLTRSVPPESPARGHVRAKSGSYWVDNPFNGHPVLTSKALAGYMDTASGRRLVFAFFVNNAPSEAIAPTVSEASGLAGKRLGKLCEVFYNDNGSTGAGPTAVPSPPPTPAAPAPAPASATAAPAP